MTSSPNLSPFTIFLVFLRLGCISFGGPVAHLGYLEESLVRKRRWLDQAQYADLVALCQFLPGPASSQVGFGIGYLKGGMLGGFAAWLGFTLPSAIIMLSFALGLTQLGGFDGAGWITGLKLAAVAVVANAVWSMASKLCPDRMRALTALGCAAFLLLAEDPLWQLAAIAAGAVVGLIAFSGKSLEPQTNNSSHQPRSGAPFLVAFFALLVSLPLALSFWPNSWLAVVDAFYRAGALVFGGGHVVLPLLDSYTVQQGWVSRDAFLAGYGAAQAVPGPLFSFAAFLGASLDFGRGGITGGIVALCSVYLPSWLLVMGALPYWEQLRKHAKARAALMGTNAAVVGLLLAAFYSPVWTGAVTSPVRAAFALVAFALLRFGQVPVWVLVASSALAGAFVL